MFNVKVMIDPKRTVADPQGLTVQHALGSLGFKHVSEVRIGRSVSFQLSAGDKGQAEAEVRDMCEKLLANPVTEEYSFEVEQVL